MHYNPVFGNVTKEGKIIFYDKKILAKEFDQLRGKEFVVKVVKRNDKRTIKQNSYLHACIALFAAETGNDPKVVKRNAKKLFSPEKIGYHFDGSPYPYQPDTSEMNKEEISIFIENFRLWSVESFNVYLPTPEEWKAGYHDLDE